MMESLSDWFGCDCNCCTRKEHAIKDFIKKLKEDSPLYVKELINKHAGARLI